MRTRAWRTRRFLVSAVEETASATAGAAGVRATPRRPVPADLRLMRERSSAQLVPCALPRAVITYSYPGAWRGNSSRPLGRRSRRRRCGGRSGTGAGTERCASATTALRLSEEDRRFKVRLVAVELKAPRVAPGITATGHVMNLVWPMGPSGSRIACSGARLPSGISDGGARASPARRSVRARSTSTGGARRRACSSSRTRSSPPSSGRRCCRPGTSR